MMDDQLPNSLMFHSIQQTCSVIYMKTKSKVKLIQRPHNEIVLFGDIADKKNCLSLLLSWVKSYAKQHLILRLDHLSRETQLAYQKVRIRGQKTVWGSCTAQKTINLNYKLFFLPEHLVRYVMIHELCHTKHLNHSKRFWSLVAFYDSFWQQNRRELKEADRYIPNWI